MSKENNEENNKKKNIEENKNELYALKSLVQNELKNNPNIDSMKITFILSKNNLLKQYQSELNADIALPSITKEDFKKMIEGKK